eukprot:TRINITY_DN7390_c1_g2_i2.p1 TRINITY_DN7390_c1_g2~~TRINITY_DN7390_c1_g2_i2.p1  ORF type:complete len:177 (-),score=27.73 TRINITY_DN7390_c1_g2_i2:359-889(-)
MSASGVCQAWSSPSFPVPPALKELLKLRAMALRRLLPHAAEDLLKRIWPYLQVSAIILRSECGSRYWWAGRYLIDETLPLSESAPISRKGSLLLYRWKAQEDHRPRGPGARSRACQTEALEGEEEWRMTEDIHARQIANCSPHPAKLCLAGPLKTARWLEVTREFREPRDVLVQFE